MPTLSSLLGAATAVGSAAMVVAPQLLIGPARLTDTADTRGLVRSLAARDTGIGLVMMAAQPGAARRLATTARVLSDWTDAVAFSSALSGRDARGRIVAFASFWGALSLGALVLDERAGR